MRLFRKSRPAPKPSRSMQEWAKLISSIDGICIQARNVKYLNPQDREHTKVSINLLKCARSLALELGAKRKADQITYEIEARSVDL